jgi:hypothetical protein
MAVDDAVRLRPSNNSAPGGRKCQAQAALPKGAPAREAEHRHYGELCPDFDFSGLQDLLVNAKSGAPKDHLRARCCGTFCKSVRIIGNRSSRTTRKGYQVSSAKSIRILAVIKLWSLTPSMGRRLGLMANARRSRPGDKEGGWTVSNIVKIEVRTGAG